MQTQDRRESEDRIDEEGKQGQEAIESESAHPKEKGQGNPILEMLNNMDEDLVDMLRQSLQKEMGFGSELFGPEDPVDLFAEYLESCAAGSTPMCKPNS